MNLSSITKKNIVYAILLICFAIVSYRCLYGLYLDHTKTAILYLDEKANTTLALSGASAAASVALTLIPGDTAMPIAEKLADISGYTILILAAIHLEKYLVTLGAMISFKGLIPASLITAAVNNLATKKDAIKDAIKGIVAKLLAFALALVLMAPCSVNLSKMIEKTYQDDIQLTIEQSKAEAEMIKDNRASEDQGLLDKLFNNNSNDSEGIINNIEGKLNNFIEAIAVMLITALAIPMLTFMVLLWLIRSILQIDIPIPKASDLAKKNQN